jgi:hypothetical protein
LKDESRNPTLSSKDRMYALIIAKVVEDGYLNICAYFNRTLASCYNPSVKESEKIALFENPGTPKREVT